MSRRKTNVRNKSNSRRDDKSFKKTLNRDVTQEDQKQARLRDVKYSVNTGMNKPEWYAKDPALLRDAASISYNWATGTQIRLGASSTTQAYTKDLVVPGLCTLELAPCCGFSVNANSAVNVAAQALYSFVRHANSGSRNYDNPDLMMYVIAMSNVYSAITWLERVYGESMLYAMNNRYMPDALLSSQGLAVDGAAGSLAQFRYGINLIINKASSFAVPSNFPVFERHAFLFQNLYKDGSSDKTQLYQYVPYGFYKFGTDNDGASQLSLAPWNLSGSATYDELLSYVNDLLQPLLQYEDIGIMSGDILKAYGSDGILKLYSLEESYMVEPVYDMEVLEQFKNARGISISAMTNTTINQGTNKVYITYAPTWESSNSMNSAAAAAMCQDATITTQLVNPGPEATMVNSRLISVLVPEATNSWSVIVGTELVGNFRIYTWSYSNNVRTLVVDAWQSTMSWDDTMGFISVAPLLARLNYFDMHPQLHAIIWNATKNTLTGQYAFFDLDNWAVLTYEQLRKLHETAILSEFKVDQVAKAYTG